MPVNKNSHNHNSSTSGIFGTPAEPLFNNDENGSSAEILQDWLLNMAVVNTKEIRTSSSIQVARL